MGGINEIVGICMAAHLNWALGGERERENGDEMGSGEVTASKGGETQTLPHTHTRTHTYR